MAEYRDMTTIIRDRIQLMIDKGMTLAQVKAARPSTDYDVLLLDARRGRGRCFGSRLQQLRHAHGRRGVRARR